MKEKTCFKSSTNPSSIDLFLTNSPMCFQNTSTTTTGLSDFHKMVVTVMKMSFQKDPPKEVYYRDYKKFNKELFKEELKKKIDREVGCYETFEKMFISVLEKHAPLKKKVLRANHAPYMTKALRKAIMRRSQLQTKYYKKKSHSNYVSFKKQKNFCSKLYKKERKKYYDALDIKKVTDNKQFWKTIKPFLSEKSKKSLKITLKSEEKIISNEGIVAEEFSTFFENAVKSLGIDTGNPLLGDTTSLDNPVEIAIKKFENHSSVKVIKENICIDVEFDFKQVQADEILK